MSGHTVIATVTGSACAHHAYQSPEIKWVLPHQNRFADIQNNIFSAQAILVVVAFSDSQDTGIRHGLNQGADPKIQKRPQAFDIGYFDRSVFLRREGRKVRKHRCGWQRIGEIAQKSTSIHNQLGSVI